MSNEKSKIPGIFQRIYGGGLFSMSQSSAAILTVTVLFVFFLLLIASITSWPTLIGIINQGGESAEIARGIFIPALIGAAVCLILSLFLAMHMNQGEYHLFARFVPCFVVELLAIYLGMIINHADLVSMIPKGYLGGNFMTLTINGICGVVLAILPAFLSALLGWLLHTIPHFFLNLEKKD